MVEFLRVLQRLEHRGLHVFAPRAHPIVRLWKSARNWELHIVIVSQHCEFARVAETEVRCSRFYIDVEIIGI